MKECPLCKSGKIAVHQRLFCSGACGNKKKIHRTSEVSYVCLNCGLKEIVKMSEKIMSLREQMYQSVFSEAIFVHQKLVEALRNGVLSENDVGTPEGIQKYRRIIKDFLNDLKGLRGVMLKIDEIWQE